jgi:hypothetical protein
VSVDGPGYAWHLTSISLSFCASATVWVCPLKSGSLSVSAPIHTHTHARFSLTLFYLPLLVRCIARSLASSSPGLPGASSRLILTQILCLFESHFPNLTSTALYCPVPWPVKRQATNPMPSPFVRPIGRLPSIHTTSKIADSCSRHMHKPLLKAPRLVLVAPPTNKVTRGHPQTQRHYRF